MLESNSKRILFFEEYHKDNLIYLETENLLSVSLLIYTPKIQFAINLEQRQGHEGGATFPHENQDSN